MPAPLGSFRSPNQRLLGRVFAAASPSALPLPAAPATPTTRLLPPPPSPASALASVGASTRRSFRESLASRAPARPSVQLPGPSVALLLLAGPRSAVVAPLGPGLCLHNRPTASLCLRPVCSVITDGGQCEARFPQRRQANGAVARPATLLTARWLTAAPPPVNVAAAGPRPTSRRFQAQLISWREPVRAHVVTYVVSRAGGPQRGASPGRDPFDAEKSFLKTSDQPASRITRKSSSVFRVPTDPPYATPADAEPATWRTESWIFFLDF